jgi:hypothetical protein
MKKYTLISLFFVILTVFLIATSAFGASGNTFKFSDSLQDKVLCLEDYGYCDVFPSGKFQINVKINFEDGNVIDQFNSDTCLGIDVGDIFLFSCLGDDPRYQNGTTRANIVYSDEDFWTGENAPYLWVKLKWNAKKLTAKIKGITGLTVQYPILADDYMWGDVGPVQDDSVVANVTLDDGHTTFIDNTFDLYVNGNVKMKTKRKGEDTFDCYSVKLKGQGYN